VTTTVQDYVFEDPSLGRYAFVLANVRRTDQETLDPISLSLSGAPGTSFLRIDDFLYGRVTSDSEKDWRNRVFIET
jgi:hypothetical protein